MENTWNGHRMETFYFEERNAIIVFPKEGTNNGCLAIKTEYWGAFPEAAEIGLLERGFHLCFVGSENRWGGHGEIDRKARFIRFVAEKYGLCQRTVPVGMSCGGLCAIQLAAKYPELIACLYLDAPVLNFLSCPMSFGVGNSGIGPEEFMRALDFENISQVICCREMPMDRIPALVANKIPVVMVAGDSDVVVPYCENGQLLQDAYEKAGLELQVFLKPGCDHHPHGLENPEPVLNFILTHLS